MKTLKRFLYEEWEPPTKITGIFDVTREVKDSCEVISNIINKLKVTEIDTLKQINYNSKIICDELNKSKISRYSWIKKIYTDNGKIIIDPESMYHTYRIIVIVGEDTFGSISKDLINSFSKSEDNYYILVNKSKGIIYPISADSLRIKIEHNSIQYSNEHNCEFVDGKDIDKIILKNN